MAITLLRHTTPLAPQGLCYGRTDLELAESFAEEAATVAAAAPAASHIVTSPLTRCRRLAQFLADRAGAPVSQDPRLIEMDFGSWEGRLWTEIPRDEIDAWTTDFMNARPHGGESVAMLKERTFDALNDILAMERPTIIVTHAGVIKAALSTGDSPENFNTQIGFGQIAAWPQP